MAHFMAFALELQPLFGYLSQFWDARLRQQSTSIS